MAVNPITSESLTVDYKSLMKIPIADRVKAATSVDTFAQSILTALTPIEIAKAFPDYYRRQLPDISNFLAASRYLDGGGTPHQTGGGEQGYTPTGKYDGETKPKGKRPAGTPEPTVAEMKKKLLEKGVDVDGIYNSLGRNGLLEDDPKLKAIKGMSDEKLSEAGLQRVTRPDGATIITQKMSEASALSEEEVLRRTSGKVAPGTENLEGKQKTQKQVYDSFIKAGFSDKQAIALTSEVGRENDFNESVLYGTHQDSNNGKVNLGMFSWQGDRRPALLKYLKEQGVLDENGQMIPGQESLDAMARFTKVEMENNYPKTKRLFLDNPDVDQTTAAQVLGSNYISWDMTGQYGLRNPEEHAAKRDRYYQEMIELNKKFPGILPENATKDQIEEARQKLIAQEQQTGNYNLTKNLFEKASPTSSEYVVDPADPRTYTMIPVGGTMTGKSMLSDEDVPFSGGSQGSRSFGGPRGTNQLHTGVDIPGKAGDPVLAVDNGTIVDMRKSPSGYGYTLDIQYPDGTVHRMAHLGTNDGGWKSAFAEDLKVGDTITAGQQIGTLGYSGNAGPEFPHVHYEVIRQDYYEETKGRPPGRISGRTDASMKELERGRIDPREWYRQRQEEQEKLKKDAATTPPPIPEQKAAEVQATATSEPAPSVPAEEPKLALGGNLYGLNEDLTLVDNETGEAVAQVGKNEKLVKQGTTMQVTSTDRLKAEELSQKYDTNEMETRLENIESDVEDYRTQQMQKRDVPRPAAPTAAPVDNSWRESLAMRHYDESPSYRRAMNRVRGRPETGPNQYDHFTKATIASKV